MIGAPAIRAHWREVCRALGQVIDARRELGRGVRPVLDGRLLTRIRSPVTGPFDGAPGGLTEPAGGGRMTDCVAYAEPPATVPSTVFHRRQRD